MTPNATTTTTPELLLEQENLNTNAASPPDCTANSDNYQYCAKTNDCLLLLLNPNSCSHTTNNASSTPMSSTSSSTSSSRLETIPEFNVEGLEGNPQESVKLSANFNKIYASKLSIFVDRMREEQTRSPQPLTQCDSLSSLEETSSNPDSGNVSLADFPLGQQNLNVSLQLSSNYNTRFEVRNCFKSEVTIDSKKQQKVEEKDNEHNFEQQELVEFPRLPTAEELEDSLKERYNLEENLKKTEEFLGEQSVLREKLALAKEDRS